MKHVNKKTLAFSILFVLAFYKPSISQDTTRVLFLGNSMTYVEDLPLKLKTLALSDGKIVITGQSTPGGYTLFDHTTNATTLSLLNQSWDYVVLQEQSMGLIQPATPGLYQTPIEILDSLIRSNCAKTLLYVTPGYQTGWTTDTSYLDMQNRVIGRYEVAAKSVRAGILPTGHAWRNIITNYPSINTGMWASATDYHPGLKGQYLNACSLFSAIYKKSPQGLAYPAGISASEAAIFQQVAWQETKDSIFQFGISKLDSFQIGFSESALGLNLTLTDTSSSMSNHLIWYWGDGDSTEFVPVVFQPYGTATHTYAVAGSYTVTQKVWWSNCGYNEINKTISVAPLGIGDASKNDELTISPNPATSDVRINFGELNIYEIEVYDNVGRVVYENISKTSFGKEFLLNVSLFKSAVYIIRLKTSTGLILNKKLVVQH